MISSIFWNMRGVISKKSIHKLKLLTNNNKVIFIAIYEPLVNKSNIEGHRRFLLFQHCNANTNGKILCFWNHLDNACVMENDDQQMTLTFKTPRNNSDILFTDVYANCTSCKRKELWDNIENTSQSINGPWCT